MDAGQPQRHVFPEGDDPGALVHNVRDAISALPVYFRTATRIEGLDGGELFNLSAVLGSAIEVQVVETLTCKPRRSVAQPRYASKAPRTHSIVARPAGPSTAITSNLHGRSSPIRCVMR